jgi:hypothetical protein
LHPPGQNPARDAARDLVLDETQAPRRDPPN